MSDDTVAGWLGALEQRHLANLTVSEVARALRALSSCYVERRAKLAAGGALDSTGKRAAFAVFFAPVHLRLTREIVQAIPAATDDRPAQIVDLGCGTGVAGGAWALAAGSERIQGFDRHPWAVAEATWTYRQLGLRGRAVQQDVSRVRVEGRPGTAFVAAYVVNELPSDARQRLLTALLAAHARGARVLIIEPIARRSAPWWNDWADAFLRQQGRADEWRFAADLPRRQRELARAAGLDPRELTARSLFLG